jgi:hypothetical protein
MLFNYVLAQSRRRSEERKQKRREGKTKDRDGKRS